MRDSGSSSDSGRPRATLRAFAAATGAAACLALPARAGAAGAFVDVTAEAGLVYLQHHANDFGDCLLLGGFFCEPERMTGGAAVADVDGDGDLDLYATRLDAPDLLFCNRLVETGVAHFEDCTQAAGLDAFDLPTNGAAFGDLDNDGDPDLYVTAIGTTRFYLFVNDGSGRFDEDAQARGAAVETGAAHVGYGVDFGDYDNDGWLDVQTAEWRSTLVPGPSHSRLLRNRGAAAPGIFEDVTTAAGVALASGEQWAFAPALRDLDHDGWPDLALASDFGTSRLFWNQRDGTFLEGTAAAGVGTDENGMGSTFGDVDGDADVDWFVTSIHDPDDTCSAQPCGWGASGNRLYRNEGARQFSDQTGDAPTGVRAGAWGWGAAFLDYDLDGDLDLVMTNGVDFPDLERDAVWNADPMRLWRNDGPGAWTEVSALEGVTDTRSGKGLLVFDYDADGDLDVFVANNADGPVLYENQTARPGGPRWLRVRAIGRSSNRDALGARVSVRPAGGARQVRTIGSSSHFLGWSDPAAHFGFGDEAARVRVTVVFPASGAQRGLRLEPTDLDRTLVVIEPPALPRCGLGAIEGALAVAALRAARRRRLRGGRHAAPAVAGPVG